MISIVWNANVFCGIENSNPTDDALLGAKLLLEENNWDHSTEKSIRENGEEFDALANAKPKQVVKRNYLKYAAIMLIAFCTGLLYNWEF
jgi:hypothetical protein